MFIKDFQSGNQAGVDDLNALFVTQRSVLVGSPFTGAALDPSQYTSTNTGSATSAVSNGVLQLVTGATANSTSNVISLNRAIKQAGTFHMYYGVIQLSDTGIVNNTRRWGAYNTQDGFYFELLGTSLGIVTRLATVNTRVTSFNVKTPTIDTNPHSYQIIYAQGTARFYQDGNLLHAIGVPPLNPTPVFVGNPNLNISYDNINSGGLTTTSTLNVIVSSISRLGQVDSRYQASFISTLSTTVLRTGPGILKRVVIGTAGAGGNTVTIYDNTAASGTIIAVITATTAGVVQTMDFDITFNNGLTVVSAGGTSPDMTFVYG